MTAETQTQHSKRDIDGFLYIHRNNVVLWAFFALVGVALSAVFFVGINCLITQNINLWTTSQGPWTVVIVLAGSPTAWFVWYVRDKNHARELSNKEFDLENDAARLKNAEADQKQVRDEHDWEIFRQLAEWASTPNMFPEALRSAAILYLSVFVAGDSDHSISWRQLVESDRLAWSAQLLLKALLTARGWQEHTPAVPFAVRSPIEQSITTAIRELDRGSRVSNLNFAGWNLSGLVLNRAQWSRVKLTDADLRNSVLTNSVLKSGDLRKANFSGSLLSKSDLVGAELGGAKFQNADLTGCNMQNARVPFFDPDSLKALSVDFSGALLAGANLIGADLSDASFNNAFVDGLIIERKWMQKLAQVSGISGTPIFVDNVEV